jgi:hypothetical protein
MTRDRAPSAYSAALSGYSAAILACSAALFLPLAWPLLAGRVFVYNDLVWFHLPMRHLYQQALRAGDSILWTPAIFSGLYLLGEGQTGVFHPLHLLWYLVLPLQAAFGLEMAASYAALFAGTAWFLRRLRFSVPAALFGAMLFAFSGFNLLHHHHLNMVAVVAHLPWLLGAADVVLTAARGATRATGFAAMALVTASAFLLGFPQAVWWNVMALGAFAAFRAHETGGWRRLAPCAAAVAIGMLLGSIQIVPSADAAAHSIRASLTREFALTYSLHPFNLVQLWAPYFFERGVYGRLDYPWFHELGIYSGAILPVALIWVWMRRSALPARRPLIVAATAFAAFTLVLALGRHGGLAWLLTYLPVLGSLRAPVRYIVLTQFALTILAAIALDDLIAIAAGRSSPPAGPMAPLWIPAGLGVATFVLNLHILPYGPRTFSSAGVAAPGVVFMVSVTALLVLAARRVRWAVAALVVVTAADLAWWGVRFIYQERPRTIVAVLQAAAPPPPGGEPAYAIAPGGGPLRGDVLVMKGYRLTSGYVALFPATRHPLDSDEALRLSGTQWRIDETGARVPWPGGVPRARLVDERGASADGTARVAADRPGRITVHVDAPGPRILALTERFHDGWTASADGRPVRTVAVEGDFLGAAIDAGVRRVEFRFLPRSFVYGAIGSAAGVVLLAAAVFFMRRAGRGDSP